MKIIEVITKEEMDQVLNLRRKVFIEEQGVPESLEIDAFESNSHFFLLYFKEIPVSTGRFRLTAEGLKLERFLTLKEYRGKGLGKELLKFMQDWAKKNHPKVNLYLNAQESAIGFYEKSGWKCIGDYFVEANIKHKKMIY